jgi:hypothetical protein
MGEIFCSACQEEEEMDFKIVKDYIAKHPDAKLYKIIEATGVKPEVVLELLRKGKITPRPKKASA